MSSILKRNDFVKEIYDPMMEQKRYEELKKMNEGKLSTLFGVVKNLFRQEWSSIKGDQSVIKAYKEIDDKLTGYTMMKMSKKDICNKIRQYLVDFACDWYDYKKNQAKDNDMEPAKNLKFKDDTLKENLEKTKKMIKEVAEGDKQMIKWAELLMDEMTIVINRVILKDIEDDEVKKEIEKAEADKIKQLEDNNKKQEELQAKQLDEVSKDRESAIKSVASSVIDGKMTGDKAATTLAGEFKKIAEVASEVYEINESIEINESDTSKLKEDKEKILQSIKNDEMLGLKNIYKDLDKIKKPFKTAYTLMYKFYKSLGDTETLNKFKEVPSQSIQAMCISINSFIKHTVYQTDPEEGELTLMAKCAIISNGVISYNLPIDGSLNYLTKIFGMISDGEFGDLTSKMKTKASELMKKIQSEAEKLKKEGEEKYSKENDSADIDIDDDDIDIE